MGDRSLVLAALQRERAEAAGACETARVAEIDAQMIRLSAGLAGDPSQETASRRPAAAARRRNSGPVADRT